MKQLTVFERMMWANQMRIMEALDIEGWNNNTSLIQALEQNYVDHYQESLRWILSDENKEVLCANVRRVLQMLMDLRHAYDALSEEDQEGIKEYDVTFMGFCGNTETDMMAYANYLLEVEGRGYQSCRIKGGDYNAHSPMMGHYMEKILRYEETMQRIKEEFLKTHQPRLMTRDEIIFVVTTD